MSHTFVEVKYGNILLITDGAKTMTQKSEILLLLDDSEVWRWLVLRREESFAFYIPPKIVHIICNECRKCKCSANNKAITNDNASKKFEDFNCGNWMDVEDDVMLESCLVIWKDGIWNSPTVTKIKQQEGPWGDNEFNRTKLNEKWEKGTIVKVKYGDIVLISERNKVITRKGEELLLLDKCEGWRWLVIRRQNLLPFYIPPEIVSVLQGEHKSHLCSADADTKCKCCANAKSNNGNLNKAEDDIWENAIWDNGTWQYNFMLQIENYSNRTSSSGSTKKKTGEKKDVILDNGNRSNIKNVDDKCKDWKWENVEQETHKGDNHEDDETWKDAQKGVKCKGDDRDNEVTWKDPQGVKYKESYWNDDSTKKVELQNEMWNSKSFNDNCSYRSKTNSKDSMCHDVKLKNRKDKIKISDAHSLQSSNKSFSHKDPENFEVVHEKSEHKISEASPTCTINNNLPAAPSEHEIPTRLLLHGWAEYVHQQTGRKYYHHAKSKTVKWKPPRFDEYKQSKQSSIDGKPAAPKPPPKEAKPTLQRLVHRNDTTDSSASSFTILPPGWHQEVKDGIGIYFNYVSNQKWFSSVDENGRSYFYREDGLESMWELPRIEPLSSESIAHKGTLMITDPGSINAPRLPWRTLHVILTDMFLLSYKDINSTQATIPDMKPEICINLHGAVIEWCPGMTNVFMVTTILGNRVFLKDDNVQAIKEWFDKIHQVIMKLTSDSTQSHKITTATPTITTTATTTTSSNSSTSSSNICLKRSPSEICRGKKILERPDAENFSLEKAPSRGNNTDNVDAIPPERKRKIRDRLINFFVRRPTLESLREKGILQDEPVFGCNLESLCSRENRTVPRFVVKCISVIEEKGMTVQGLYRASGNISHIQTIRVHVNQGDYSCLDQEEDVHVLTGALKMFFREMKEPLFPFNTFHTFLQLIGLHDVKYKLKMLKLLIKDLPPPNYETLKYLLEHLNRVIEYQKQNLMQSHNLAIVFGPTLMWPEVISPNIACDMMLQNTLIEFLLLEFHAIFTNSNK